MIFDISIFKFFFLKKEIKKKGGTGLVTDYLGKILIGLLFFIVMILGIALLFGDRGVGGIFNSIKDFFRFGR